MTLRQLTDQWLKVHRYRIAPSTYYTYTKYTQDIISYWPDDKAVESLASEELQEYVHTIVARGYSAAHVRHLISPLRMALDYGVIIGVIDTNPFKRVTIPRLPRQSDLRAYSIEEVNQVLAHITVEWFRIFVLLAYRTGMRRGEIMALQWHDIDLEQRYIMVRHTQAISETGGMLIKAPKTASSRRRIDIDRHLTQELVEYKETVTSTYLFPSPLDDSKPRSDTNISYRFRMTCEQASITPLRFHALRHTHATILLGAGEHPQMVQERLGHSRIDTTINVYSHVAPTMQQGCVEVFDNIPLAEPPKKQPASKPADKVVDFAPDIRGSNKKGNVLQKIVAGGKLLFGNL